MPRRQSTATKSSDAGQVFLSGAAQENSKETLETLWFSCGLPEAERAAALEAISSGVKGFLEQAVKSQKEAVAKLEKEIPLLLEEMKQLGRALEEPVEQKSNDPQAHLLVPRHRALSDKIDAFLEMKDQRLVLRRRAAEELDSLRDELREADEAPPAPRPAEDADGGLGEALLAHLQAELEEARNRVRDLESRSGEMESQRNQAGEQQAEMNRRAEDAERRLRESEKRTEDALHWVEEKEQEANRLRSELEGLKTALEATRKSAGSKEGEVAELRREVSAMQERLREASELADRDPLIPVLNRRAFVRELSRVIAYARRYGDPAGLVYFDIDNFKQVNDAHGHAAGDAALHHLAKLVLGHVRETDIAGRLGGDELGLILVRTDEADAKAKAQSLAELVAGQPLRFGGKEISLSISVGAVAFTGEDGPDDALARADRAMYEAKRNGG